MSDLIIVFIGLGLILYFFFVLATSRNAIFKGYNGVVWFLLSLILPPIAYFTIIFLPVKKSKGKEQYNSFDNIVIELTQPFIDLAHTSRALLGVNISYVLEGLTYFAVLRKPAI